MFFGRFENKNTMNFLMKNKNMLVVALVACVLAAILIPHVLEQEVVEDEDGRTIIKSNLKLGA
jgi:hypothetical protein